MNNQVTKRFLVSRVYQCKSLRIHVKGALGGRCDRCVDPDIGTVPLARGIGAIVMRTTDRCGWSKSNLCVALVSLLETCGAHRRTFRVSDFHGLEVIFRNDPSVLHEGESHSCKASFYPSYQWLHYFVMTKYFISFVIINVEGARVNLVLCCRDHFATATYCLSKKTKTFLEVSRLLSAYLGVRAFSPL